MIKLINEDGTVIFVRTTEIIMVYEINGLTIVRVKGEANFRVKEAAEKIVEMINAL